MSTVKLTPSDLRESRVAVLALFTANPHCILQRGSRACAYIVSFCRPPKAVREEIAAVAMQAVFRKYLIMRMKYYKFQFMGKWIVANAEYPEYLLYELGVRGIRHPGT